jgi:hypothetical protein
MEAQGLKSLQLALPVMLPCQPHLMAGTQYPAIIHLEIKLTRAYDPDVIFGIAIALKPSLKLLTIRDWLHLRNSRPLLPVYETLRETIEGLSVNDCATLLPILHLSFPMLRVLVIHGWLTPFVDVLSQDIFCQAPIGTIAINSIETHPTNLTVHMFSHLSRLRKLVFMNAKPNYSPPSMYLTASEAHHIECIYLDHGDLSQIMASQMQLRCTTTFLFL